MTGALLWSGIVPAEAWCELLFKDIARAASAIVLAEYRIERGQAPSVHVVEVLQGECARESLPLQSFQLPSNPRDGDRFLLALTQGYEPVSYLTSHGTCSAVNFLPIRKGRLSARVRADYDGENTPMTLEQLRLDLAEGRADPP